ncbi:uncharacterized protein LOC119554713 isoform X1 [Drosophila subpulchrella]|uniref:uncharacterized protein LOC119554713 isoform X1 n=1 Tax=Drosophila subpulchrella TaxID=1486046 RepID=UPI0018A13B48|nr:uncharacterized protein LOC119554713 isoform X1 [Drosophila subpulchrella]
MSESSGDDPDAACVVFYGMYTIVVGVLALLEALYITCIFFVYMYDDREALMVFVALLTIGYLIVSATYVVAGTLLVVGMKRRSIKLFRCGKILSYFYPIFSFPLVYTIIVHFICMPKLRRYCERTWH